MANKKVGRPKLNISEDLIRGMAEVGCPPAEIALLVGCTPKTITNRFSKILDETSSNLKKKLRQKQIEVALSGHWPALQYLGQVLLEQRIINQTELVGNKDNPVVIRIAPVIDGNDNIRIQEATPLSASGASLLRSGEILDNGSINEIGEDDRGNILASRAGNPGEAES